MKAYYARSIDQYGEDHDKFCIDELETLGFEVVDPNDFFTQEEYDKKGMDMFYERIDECDVFFFRALPNKRITAGVFKELLHALGNDIPMYEMPFDVASRAMSVEETREYLKEKGVR
jgi:hypothetical protein